jgi:predicted dehydrogenase
LSMVVVNWCKPQGGGITGATASRHVAVGAVVRWHGERISGLVMSDLRIGIIGVGRFGTRHASNLSSMTGVAVTAIADLDADRAKALADQFGASWYTDHRSLLDQRDVDAVVIAVPHKFLSEVAIDAAQAGKHLLCQKPMALNSRDGERVVAAAEDAGVKLMVYGQNRYRADYGAARELVQSGELGEFYLLEEARKFQGFTEGYPDWFKSNDLAGGGVLQNFTCHSVDVMRWLLDREVASVYAMMGRYYFEDIEGEDNAALLLRFDNGAIGSSVQSWSTNGNWMEITGTKGRLRIEDNVVSLRTNGGWQEVARRSPTEDERYMLEAYFVSCLMDGLEPSPSGREYLGVIRTIEAAYRSAEAGREVTLAEAGLEPSYGGHRSL